ncbi:glycoside hydrolase family 65 protein [Rhodospira trueperi]|uniref:Trehalose and maltose hydrolase (Possible phosphorylase) n=1 Tax=Rhodospira trueperi TaxID=69960 RepID=A0A1G6WVA5_9PROT|nr:glycosyl hydrolase family 65 protein [Rhodospira trueperi]SDD69563.1 Trehalose and maltose hydrolase (possible phosphorylase) [Rhodospira trueperi]
MSEWSLIYDQFEPKQQGLREALCATGNGYFVTRGAFSWVMADETHYPATYLAGGYNRAPTEVAGRVIENEDLVNMPNWSALTFRIEGGDWFNIQAVTIETFRQELDLKRGILEVEVRFRDKQNRESTLKTRRLASMADMHLAGIEMSLTAHNWSGRVDVMSGLDGRVINAGVKRYRDLNSSHLNPVVAEPFQNPDTGETMINLLVETKQSKLRVSQAARIRVVSNPHAFQAKSATEGGEEGYIEQTIHVDVGHGETVVVEKLASLYTSRDPAISEPGVAAREAVTHAPAFGRLLHNHERVWAMLWDRCDIIVEDGKKIQMILRLHIFHLLQTLSPNTIDLDVGVPARGWHGEAYRGHVFWDELFILPFLNFRLPAIARSCLRYRHLRLPEARWAAFQSGLKGSMFPWQSGSDGREESQKVHLNPRSGRWVPDNSCIQRHVSLAIAYNVWRHYEISGAEHFLELRGAELILEITRFFASLAHLNPQTGRYEIHHVMGPDEYHEAYPDKEDEAGLNNNAYTNIMVAWLCTVAMRVMACLDATHRDELMDRLMVDERELALWEDMSRKMIVCYHDDGIISQFEGYENLKEFDWEGYRAKYGDIQRLDRILEAEGDSANRYKLSKQADVLMLFYLFSREELSEMLERLGYEPLTEERWQTNIDYYLARTSHGSTLSYMVHAAVMARSHPEKAWQLFTQALHADIDDIQGGTTPEGIHLGAMAGTVDLVQRCFTGLDVRDGALHFDPVFTDRMGTLKLKLRHLGRWLDVTLGRDEMTVAAHRSWARALTICVRGEARELLPGESITFRLSHPGEDPVAAD